MHVLPIQKKACLKGCVNERIEHDVLVCRDFAQAWYVDARLNEAAMLNLQLKLSLLAPVSVVGALRWPWPNFVAASDQAVVGIFEDRCLVKKPRDCMQLYEFKGCTPHKWFLNNRKISEKK